MFLVATGVGILCVGYPDPPDATLDTAPRAKDPLYFLPWPDVSPAAAQGTVGADDVRALLQQLLSLSTCPLWCCDSKVTRQSYA